MTLKNSKDAERVTYSDLARVVDDNETLQFLQGSRFVALHLMLHI